MSLAIPAQPVVFDRVARSPLANIALVLGSAAFIGLAAQISIPIPGTPVPLTGQTFAVLFVAAAAGLGRGVASTLVYAVLGCLGVPWFAEGSSGIRAVSFGYIIGFIAASALVGYLARLGWSRTIPKTFVAMLLGSMVIYAIGVPWLKFAADVTWTQAISLGLIPFILGDILKALLAAGIFRGIWIKLDR